MKDCKPVSTLMVLNEKLQLNDATKKAEPKNYRSFVGSLICLMNTRRYIVYAVSFISRFLHEPSKNHYTIAKGILHYLQRTKKLGINYVREQNSKLIGYTNSD